MMRALLIVVSIAFASAACAAQPIGRLFFTPAERAQLDVQRVQKQRPPSAAAAAEAAPEAAPPPQVITYNGIVRRSDGQSILWLNNRPVAEKDALSGLALNGRVRADGAVVIEVPETGGRINLKVGQRAEVQTGRVSEARPPAVPKGEAKAEGAAKGEAPAKSEGAGKSEPAKTEGASRSEPAARSDAPATRPTAESAKAPDNPAIPPQYARDGVPPGAVKSRTP